MSRRSRNRRTLELTVSDLDEAMHGRAWAEGREVLLPNVLPGETVTAEILARGRGRRYARPLAWHESSPRRRRAPCPAFGICGGCALQHLAREEQLDCKRRRLLERLEAAGIVPDEVSAPVTGPLLRYRRKARLAVRHLAAKGEVLVGFREAIGNKVVRIESCPVLAAPFGELIAPLKALIGGLSVRAAVPQLEIAAGDSGAAIILRHLDALTRADQLRLERFQCDYDVQVLLQSAGYDSITGLNGRTPQRLSYRLDSFGVNLAFEASDFIQVNAEMNVKLVQAVIDALALRPCDRVLDLFCGIGNFTLPVARRGTAVTGIEGGAGPLARARHNARVNALEHRVTLCGVDLHREASAVLSRHGAQPANKAIVDPPRSGAGAALELLAQPHIERIIYASCHPRSFVEDAAALRELGYDCTGLEIFDMFPHTAHMETLGVFKRR